MQRGAITITEPGHSFMFTSDRTPSVITYKVMDPQPGDRICI